MVSFRPRDNDYLSILGAATAKLGDSPSLTSPSLIRAIDTVFTMSTQQPSTSATNLPVKDQSSIDDAISKLHTVSEAIGLRGGVKDTEDKRIRQAFKSLQGDIPQASVKTKERHASYQQFLMKVNELCGPSMVILCAAALGIVGVTGLRDPVKLRLPLYIRQNQEALYCPVLASLEEQYNAGGRGDLISIAQS
jgi:hypothetical protein